MVAWRNRPGNGRLFISIGPHKILKKRLTHRESRLLYRNIVIQLARSWYLYLKMTLVFVLCINYLYNYYMSMLLYHYTYHCLGTLLCQVLAVQKNLRLSLYQPLRRMSLSTTSRIELESVFFICL